MALDWIEKERMQTLLATKYKCGISCIENKLLLPTKPFTATLHSSSFVFFQ